MAHRRLGKSHSGKIQFLHELQTDGPARFPQTHLLQLPSANQSEIAVQIPDRDPKQPPNQPSIKETDPDTMFGIVPSDLISIRGTGLFSKDGQETSDLPDVILPVSVRVEDPRLGRALEPGSERPAITSVCFVKNELESRVPTLKSRQ